MSIETVNQLFTGLELVGAVVMIGYMLIKTDWKQEHEFERLMREIHHTYAPRKRVPRRNTKPRQ